VTGRRISTSKTVEGLSLALEGIYDIHGCDSLMTRMLSVGHTVTDDILEEDLKHTAGLLIDETGDMLHTTTMSSTVDGGLGDALDVIVKDLVVTLGTSLSKNYASFSTTRHYGLFLKWTTMRILL
jgi:hypothetical protein